VLTQYDPAIRVKTFLRANAIPQQTWGGIVDCSTGLVSEYLNDRKQMPGDVAEKWLKRIAVISDLLKQLDGIPPNWHPDTASQWKRILSDFEDGKLLVSVVSLRPERQISPEKTQAATLLLEIVSKEKSEKV
jgi:hypothetical protein